MKNNLSNDPSPYLQQHKNNPVNWQLWNKSTLKDAKTFIEHLNIYIKTAENYINGQYDQDEMSINDLVDDLNATSKYMTIKFPSYKN